MLKTKLSLDTNIDIRVTQLLIIKGDTTHIYIGDNTHFITNSKLAFKLFYILRVIVLLYTTLLRLFQAIKYRFIFEPWYWRSRVQCSKAVWKDIFNKIS